MIWTKGAHQSPKFQTFDCSRKISRNLYFDRLLLLKLYKISKSTEKKYWLVVSRMTRIWWILTRALKSLTNFHFDWFLLCRVFNVWWKKVQTSYLSWQWKVMQNLTKNWLVVWKMTWEIWQIFTKGLKTVKIWTLMGSFCPK